MSLIHWWQLNGDLKDYGTNPIDLTNSGATIDNNGKIGKCYSFDGNDRLYTNINLTAEMSFSAWVKLNNTNEGFLIDARNSSGIGYQPLFIGYHYGVQFYSSNASQSINWSVEECGLSLNTWYQMTITISSTNVSLYINGNLIRKVNGSYGYNYGTSLLSIGSRYSNERFLNAYINDIRIYDHALSQKEVKEISKGLVLDYNFEEMTRENLLTGDLNITTTKDGSTTTGSLDYNLPSDLNTLIGKTLIFSYDLKCTGTRKNETGAWQNDRYGVHGYMTYTTSAGGSVLTTYPFTNYLDPKNINQRVVMKYTIPTTVYSIVQFNLARQNFNMPASTNNDTWYIKNVKLEIVPSSSDTASEFYGTNDGIVRDNSGYGNNATIYGNLGLSTSSATGKYSAVFNGTNSYTSTPQLTFIKNKLTINAWAYKDNWSGTNGERIVSCTEAGGYQLALGENIIKFLCHANGSYHSTSVSRDTLTSGWHMFTGTYDGANVKFYIDGVQAATTSATGNIGYGNTFLALGVEPGGGTATTSNWFSGKISDFKIYATALSADDIKLEYQRKASIDKNGNLFSPEFIEDNSNIKITKTQITKAGQFVEGNTKTQFKETYDNNSNVIHTNQIKEV